MSLVVKYRLPESSRGQIPTTLYWNSVSLKLASAAWSFLEKSILLPLSRAYIPCYILSAKYKFSLIGFCGVGQELAAVVLESLH